MTTKDNAVVPLHTTQNMRNHLKKIGVEPNQAIDIIIYQLQDLIKVYHPKIYVAGSWRELKEQLRKAKILKPENEKAMRDRPLFSNKYKHTADIFHILWTATATIGEDKWYNKSAWKDVRDQINDAGLQPAV